MVVHRAEDGWAHSGGGDLVEHGAERFVVVAHALHEDDVNFARAAAGGRGGQAAEDEGAALGTVGVAAWTAKPSTMVTRPPRAVEPTFEMNGGRYLRRRACFSFAASPWFSKNLSAMPIPRLSRVPPLVTAR